MDVIRERGVPDSDTIVFGAIPGPPYVVDLDDLGSQGADGSVELNGVILLAPRDEGDVAPRHFNEVLTLAAVNTLVIRLLGKPGSLLRVAVWPQLTTSVAITAVTVGGTSVPVNTSNVTGPIDVALDVDAGGQAVSSVDILLDGAVAFSTPFTPGPGGGVVHIVGSIRTSAFDAATGVVSFYNGIHQLSARANIAGGTHVVSPNVGLSFNNPSGWVAQVSNAGTNPGYPAAARNRSTGLTWTQGTHDLKLVGLSYVQGVAFSGVTVRLFGVTTTLATGAGTQVATASYVASAAWNGVDLRLGNYLGPAAGETPAITASSLGSGQPGATTLLNDATHAPGLGLPPFTPIRVDNTAPGLTSANGVVQAALATTTPVFWVNAATSFAAGNLGIPSAAILDASTGGVDVEEGVDSVSVEVWVTPIGGTLPGGCSTTGLARILTGSQLTETVASTAYLARVVFKDALGNSSCTSLSNGMPFGADFTPPLFSSVSGPLANSGSAAPTPLFTVHGLLENASGFSATPLITRITYQTPVGTFCMTGSGAACTATATPSITASIGPNQGYYTATIDLSDQAGNTVNVFTNRLYLFDATAPFFPGGISLPAVIAGAATNTFTASVADNIDLASIYGRVAYPVGIIRHPSQTLGSFGTPFETTATVNYAVSNWIRCLNNPGDFTTTTNKPTQLAMIASDFANSTAGLLSPLFGANAENCGTVGNIAPADVFSFVQNPPNYGAGKVQVDRDGAAVAGNSSTSVALAAATDVALTTTADPFSRVDVYYLNTAGDFTRIGTATPILTQTPTSRTFLYVLTWDPDASVQTGAVVVRFIGVDAQGDAVQTVSQSVAIVP